MDSRDEVDNTLRLVCLIDELETAYKLIVAGFGDLQEIDMGNDFYHLAHQSLASGLERLMKCFICLVYEARHGCYPKSNYFSKELGHDLTKLAKTIEAEYFESNNIPLIMEDRKFISTDSDLARMLGILSDFGKFARYYNLDVVTGRTRTHVDPKSEWEEMESSLVDAMPYLKNDEIEAMYRDYYPRVNSFIIAKLERYIRAIAMQFTAAGHGGKLRQCSGAFTQFAALRDSRLGTTDYRRSVIAQKKEQDMWSRRTPEELAESPWPAERILASEFSGDWPFRSDSVTIECREGIFCVVNIEGYDFALNGSAKSRFGFPYPHDTDMAILGKSVGPFIEMARELGRSGSRRAR